VKNHALSKKNLLDLRSYAKYEPVKFLDLRSVTCENIKILENPCTKIRNYLHQCREHKKLCQIKKNVQEKGKSPRYELVKFVIKTQPTNREKVGNTKFTFFQT
jgi:hypothetical protein